MDKVDGTKIAIAMAMTIGAGLATCIGGLVPFHRKLVSLAKPSRVGIALGLSAGVMLFISLVEIFGKSVEGFEEGFTGNSTILCDVLNGTQKNICKGNSKSLTTIFFLIGAGIIFLLDFIVHKISPDKNHHLEVEELDNLNQADPHHLEVQNISNEQRIRQNEANQQSLNRTGILTAIAIALHNLPEGMATYSLAIANWRTAIPLAVGIALHNIPEGIAVATPVYLATKSKWKGLFYTFISALAEPLGGVLCLLLTRATLSPFVNGVMFGVVAGMMVTISLKELIPTAIRFCPSRDKICVSMLIGMFIMALSLIIFDYLGIE